MANKKALGTTPQIKAADIALYEFNTSYNTSWDWGENWSNVNTQFETFINKFLFPKLTETAIIDVALGNRFNWLAHEVDFIGQYSEEYVVMDTVPIAMNLTKNEELMLKRNYPSIATKLYKEGIVKKVKFTLNNNDVRLNFQTLADASAYAIAVYSKKISDINVAEESEIKGMLLDYALNVTSERRIVASEQDLFNKLFTGVLNLQNNSSKYNETRTASGGAIGRYTTTTPINKLAILTTDDMKTYLLDTKLANTFQVAGIDLSDIIISFDDLGGVYKANTDFTITDAASIAYLRTMGDYQVEVGDLVPAGSVFTFDVSALTDFDVTEIRPTSDLFAYCFDVDKVRYKRYTKDMLKEPFYNGEFDEVNHWIHYYSSKKMSPFFNNILFTGA